MVNSCIIGNTVCMRLTENNPLKLTDISDGKFVESRTGEKKVKVFDPPSVLKTAFLDLEGESLTGEGEFLFQIGSDNPEILISTPGKSASQIKLETLTAFNMLYGPLGYAAAFAVDGRIEVPFVPCDIGIISGSTDIGHTVTLGFDDVQPSFAICNVNVDEQVDSDDIGLIFADRGKKAVTKDARDADADGKITVNDVRICVLQCDADKCAKQ